MSTRVNCKDFLTTSSLPETPPDQQKNGLKYTKCSGDLKMNFVGCTYTCTSGSIDGLAICLMDDDGYGNFSHGRCSPSPPPPSNQTQLQPPQLSDPQQSQLNQTQPWTPQPSSEMAQTVDTRGMSPQSQLQLQQFLSNPQQLNQTQPWTPQPSSEMAQTVDTRGMSPQSQLQLQQFLSNPQQLNQPSQNRLQSPQQLNPPTSPADACTDKNPSCASWESQGMCIGELKTWMAENCARSCKTCPGTQPASPAVDINIGQLQPLQAWSNQQPQQNQSSWNPPAVNIDSGSGSQFQPPQFRSNPQQQQLNQSSQEIVSEYESDESG